MHMHIYWMNNWKMMSQNVLWKYSSYFSEVFLKITNEILQVLDYLIIYKKHMKLLNTINFIFTFSPGFVFAFQSFSRLHPSIVDVIRSLVWVLKRDCWKIIFKRQIQNNFKNLQSLAKVAHFSANCQSSSDLHREATSFFAKIEWQSPSNSICRSK